MELSVYVDLLTICNAQVGNLYTALLYGLPSILNIVVSRVSQDLWPYVHTVYSYGL